MSSDRKVVDNIDRHRRRLIGAAVLAFAAAELGLARPTSAQSKPPSLPVVRPGTNTSFRTLKQIDAGTLNVGYAEAGPANGAPVILLPGWPYDIHSFVDVAPMLASAGFRVIVPICAATGPRDFCRAIRYATANSPWSRSTSSL